MSPPRRSITPVQFGIQERDSTSDVESDWESVTDWATIQKKMTRTYVLELKGLGSLMEQANTEFYGEMEEQEDIPSEGEAARDLEKTMEAWEKYVALVRIDQTRKIRCQEFITDLINSSLCIMEQKDGIGTSSTCLKINSGDLSLDWAELFEKDPANVPL
jgi:hypothetical protein